ncbi:class I SAM-dependent methyltransferase [Halococcoides cellulosivorans]|uniref:class I SAM-dependent methyltransferase n=1 Tax=Halococcoides cellulosivorans TaxID=1679096 RepID=UPI001F26B7EA|nr:class I SAM-dependent methyltransferase [Halococcoides cellulosivorans]
MSKNPFDRRAAEYDAWFDTHAAVYRSELAALRRVAPSTIGRGLAIGVGTGRFAAPLRVSVGVDPSVAMLARARERGVRPLVGVAESLPVASDRFDTALVVTTVCFLDDLDRALAEAGRVLRPGATILVGHIDRESPLGRRYRERAAADSFYREAIFHSTANILDALEDAGFTEQATAQTLFEDADADGPDPVEAGHGEGSFVALAAQR